MNAKEQPLISVIAPVYNVKKYLPEFLDSMLAQTYQNFELLLVDDGSTDAGLEVLQCYAAQDARLRIFCKENGGVTSARNFGLEQAKGEYIGFADPDDAMLPQYLARLYAALTQQDTSMAVCGFREVWGAQMAQALSAFVPEQPVYTITTANYAYGKTGSCSQCWRALYHREVLQQVRFDTALSVGEDTVFFLQAFLQAGRFAYLPEPLYLYRQREDSAYKQPFSMRQYSEVLAWEQIQELVREQAEPFRNSAEGLLLSAYARIYYRMHDAGVEPQLQKQLIRKAHSHRKAYHFMPVRNRAEKVRVFTLLYCPHLGAKVWKLVRWVKSALVIR